jgi:hypothetical protein
MKKRKGSLSNPERQKGVTTMPIDYSKYPPNWKTEIVPAVLARAGNCCEECGLENKSTVYCIKLWLKEDGRYKFTSVWFRDQRDAKRERRDSLLRHVKVVLTIAHLDHDETNHEVKLERLKALCQICHLRYDAKEKYRRVTEKWKQPVKGE